jgi:hypothetical protein
VSGSSVGRAFEAVGVVAGAFDDAGVAAVAAFRVGLLADFGECVVEGGVKVLRG